MRPLRTVALALATALLAPAAQACLPPDPDLAEDRPLVTYSDGSFENAASDDVGYSFSGRPARDVGQGRVGQIIVAATCQASHSLLFVDCTTGSTILVGGVPGGPEEDQYLAASARALQPPYGPLALTGSTTVAEVAAVAAREGWSVVADVPGYAAMNGPRNAFDPFMGCKVFYPGSVGAGR